MCRYYSLIILTFCGIWYITDAQTFSCGDSLIDTRDGQVYKTVQIGSQCWMAENLNVGVTINSASGGYKQSDNGIIEKYCYNNEEAKCNIYGGLYEWPEALQYITTDSVQGIYVIIEGVQGICPLGWHIPTDNEWKVLEGMVDNRYGVGDPVWNGQVYRGLDAGGNLKEAGTIHWLSPNTGATNSSGFTGLPGGCRENGNGHFYDLGNRAFFWSSSTAIPSLYAWYRNLNFNKADVDRYLSNSYLKGNGFSVRCLQDTE